MSVCRPVTSWFASRCLICKAHAQAVLDEDAHGEKARTSSARRRTGAKGPLFITDSEIVAIDALLNLHGQLSGDIVLSGTISA